jgi:alkyldihydroxyacetonephosphate synthase
VPWDKCESLCANVKKVVTDECVKRGLKIFAVSFRVTQTYDAGAAVYFYFGFKYTDDQDFIQIHEEIETIARHEILASGEF